MTTQIVPAVFRCPECRTFHVDSGEWETRPHNWHLCLHCGVEFYCTGWDYTYRGVAPTWWQRVRIWLSGLLISGPRYATRNPCWCDPTDPVHGRKGDCPQHGYPA